MTRRVRFSPLLAAGVFASGAFLAASTPAAARDVPFSPRIPIAATADVVNAVAVADLDRDGDLDVLSSSFVDAKIAWYENVAGAFTTHTITTAALGASSVWTADVDGDGDVDVLAASASDDKVAWYENVAGNGSSWVVRTITTLADEARAVFAADVDRDGDEDVLSASRGDDRITWYENTAGDGSAWTVRTIATDADGARSVHAADLDGDGDVDVVSASPLDSTVAWYENTAGDGTAWLAHTVSTATNQAYAVVAADVDRDGDQDLVSASFNNDKVAWHENVDGTGDTWVLHTIATAIPGARSVAVSDLDADGDLDVLSAATVIDRFAWHENLDGAGGAWLTRTITTAADGAAAIAAADLDGDGDPDVVGASQTDDSVRWFRNQTTHRNACFAPPSTVTTDLDRPFPLAVADVDGDGSADVLSAGTHDDTVAWFRNVAADGSVWSPRTIATDTNYGSTVRAVDVDGDGDMDALSVGEFIDRLAWHENVTGDGASWATHTVSTTIPGDPRDAQAGDLDGDGDPDLLLAHTNADIVLWFQNGGGGATWTERVVATATGHVRSLAPADVDRDGDLDVVTAAGFEGSAAKIAWYENASGDGSSWTGHPISTQVASSEAVAVGDLDGDGDLDVAAGSSSMGNEHAVVTFERTAGSWVAHTLPVPAVPRSVVLQDLDADGDQDVLAGFEGPFGSGRFVWFENLPGGDWPRRDVIADAPGAHGVAVADLNGDGLPDVVGAASYSDRVDWTANAGGQVALPAIPQAPAAATAGQLVSMLAVPVAHLGRAGDSPLELAQLGLLFEEAAGDPLTTAEANAIVESLRIHRDTNGNGVFDPALDALVVSLPTLALSGGVQPVPLADGDPAVQVPASSTVAFFVVAELTANAGAQSPNRFRVVHLATGPSATVVEDAAADLPLSIACPADVASSVTAIGPGGATDVSATKTVSGLFREGGTVAYAITLSNAGPGVQADNPGAELSDVVPSSLLVTGADDGSHPGTVAVAGNTVTWDGALAASSGVTVTIRAQVKGGTAGSIVSNQAAVGYDADGNGTNEASRPSDDPALPGPADPTSFAVGLPSAAEIAHGTSRVVDLAALPGPFPDRDLFALRQEPRASYEVVIDATAGEIAAGAGPLIDRVQSDGSTVLQSSVPVGVGSARSLRFENTTASPVTGELIRVRSAGCGTGCTESDLYRVRAYETTLSGSRFNNGGTQVTVLLLQNASAEAVSGHVWLWSGAGGPVAEQPFALAPHGLLVLSLGGLAPGVAGSLTVSHDGAHGAIVGKAVALEPSTGFSFDIGLAPRPR